MVWAHTVGREQAGLRPVLVISQDVFNDRSQTVMALAITSQPQRAGYPLTFPLTEAFFPKPSWVKIGQIRTLSVERIRGTLGRCSAETVDAALAGLNEILGYTP